MDEFEPSSRDVGRWWAYKAAASRLGIAPELYLELKNSKEKICNTCSERKPDSEFSGDWRCKACRPKRSPKSEAEKKKSRRRAAIKTAAKRVGLPVKEYLRMVRLEERICCGCGIRQSLQNFAPAGEGKKGRRCKSCSQKHNAGYYQKNREKIKEQNLKYRYANLERARERENAYNKANKRARRAYWKRYEKENFERRQSRRIQRTERMLVAGEPPTAAILDNMFVQQKGKCFYCLKKFPSNKYHVEHKTPLAKGGTNDRGNLVLACAGCNLSKGAKTAEEFLGVMLI